MPTPGIERRWGYGFDQKPRKCEIVRPFVREALKLTKEGLEDLELEINDRKYVWIEQRDACDKWAGGARGKTANVSIPAVEVRRRRVDVVWLASYMLHEVVHLIHNDYVPGQGMLETAASEGLAHIAQYDFANELLYRAGRRGPPHRLVEKVRALPKREINKLESEFWKASARPYTEERFEDWFSRYAPPVGYPRGVVVGVSAVLRQLNQGYEIPELIQLPADEVLDVA